MAHEPVEMVLVARGYLLAFGFQLRVGALPRKGTVLFDEKLFVIELVFQRGKLFGS